MSDHKSPIKFSLLEDPFIKKNDVQVIVMREDLKHPVTGGNKFWKLKYNIEKAKTEKKTTLVTFGGSFSNHIAATAFAGRENGFDTVGIIRGEAIHPLNITLKRAVECGMKLIYVDRTLYRDKSAALQTALKNQSVKNYYVIPEGGSNYEGFKGCVEISGEIKCDFNYICVPCGTGTTLAGIATSLKEHQQAIGISVMKNNYSIDQNTKLFCNKQSSYTIFHDYHFGGYAKSTPELDDFVKRFIEINKIEIEPIYTGKMFFGIYELIKNGFFKKGDIVIAIHTGGMQYLG
jgi:1-aminocyclopropane-1-carboxylate deaminase/D-cysteine desulfhydrase-like pyridoxal-dependent ACC family enzyme